MRAESSEISLDEIGIRHGTDKSSLVHDYLRHYDRMFGTLRRKKITLIEIGVMNGASLDMWEEYLTTATIVGIDIAPGCRRFAHGRVHVEIGSQDDGDFLDQVVGQYDADIMIDDGSHRADHIMFSFEQLFPALRPGGCYVVEDISGHGHPGGERFLGTATVNPIDYFLKLQRSTVAAWFDPTKNSQRINAIWRSVDRAEIANGFVAIWKKGASGPELSADRLETLTECSGRHEAWIFLSQYLERKIGDLPRALAVAGKAVALMPENPWARLRLSQVQYAAGDIEVATVTASALCDAYPDALFQDWLKRLLAERVG